MNTTFNPFSLDGKTILVTGAASGIGKATVIVCVKMGANIVAADFNAEGLVQTMAELEGKSHQQYSINLADENTWGDLLTNTPVLDGIAHQTGVVNGEYVTKASSHLSRVWR